MATESGSQSAVVELRALERGLEREPTSYRFFQAVRLLEKLHPERSPVGGYGEPGEEVVRFSSNPVLSFPPSEIASLGLGGQPARMGINFMGLVGPQGALPAQYTLLVAERRRARDHALGAFLDIFNHRMISLLHRAWEKYQFTVGYEKGQDRLRQHLLDLAGMGLEAARNGLDVPDEVLAYYAGLLILQPRGAAALEQMIGDFFGVPVEVEQFVGGWYPLSKDDQCTVGADGEESNQLGFGAVVGDEVWDQQTRIRLRIGPLTRERYGSFLPQGTALDQLRSLVRLFTEDAYDVEVQLVMEQQGVLGCVLGADDGGLQSLGWSTWIQSGPRSGVADDTILSL
jgi:type VI secretion system protein ImpH